MNNKIMLAISHYSTAKNPTEAYLELAVRSAVERARHPDRLGVVVMNDSPEGGGVMYPNLAEYVRCGHDSGTINSWNTALRHFQHSSDAEFLVLANNDVIFMRDWDEYLLQPMLEREDCGIVGPVTNQPGHQPMQLIEAHGSNDPIAFAKLREDFIAATPTPPYVQVPFVNGFCFLLKRGRIVEDRFHGVTSKFYGGEDVYQIKMQNAGLRAYAASGSWVFHFKDVTIESWRGGRMGLDISRLPRLEVSEREHSQDVRVPGMGTGEGATGD